MDIVCQVKEAVSVLKLDKLKMAEVARSKDATLFGIGFLAVPAVINVILAILTSPSGFGSIASRYVWPPIIVPVLSFAATIFLMSLIAEKFFHGNKDHIGFFRIMSYASVALWVMIVPFVLSSIGFGFDVYYFFGLLNLAAGVYLLYVAYNVLMEHHKLTKENAVYTIIVAFFISIVASSIFGSILVGSGYRMY